MRISYLSPTITRKKEKTFSFRNTKPVLIFTADKPKENKKENINLTDAKNKIFSDNDYDQRKENMLTELRDYSSYKPKNFQNENLNFLQNGKRKKFLK